MRGFCSEHHRHLLLYQPDKGQAGGPQDRGRAGALPAPRPHVSAPSSSPLHPQAWGEILQSRNSSLFPGSAGREAPGSSVTPWSQERVGDRNGLKPLL